MVMAISFSSPPLPSLFPLSTSKSNPHLKIKIKRQNYLRKTLSISKSSADFSANQPIQSTDMRGDQREGAKVKTEEKPAGMYSVSREEPWWYRLPFVLGILLCGGETDDAPRGLYSLQIEPNSTNRDTMSYAITFQDRIDATHCCCVLEAFFDGLNDVSAEIIPFTIQEIKEEVQSGRLNVIVVPKGKLKLYAGQPLEEVKVALCSFVN